MVSTSMVAGGSSQATNRVGSVMVLRRHGVCSYHVLPRRGPGGGASRTGAASGSTFGPTGLGRGGGRSAVAIGGRAESATLLASWIAPYTGRASRRW